MRESHCRPLGTEKHSFRSEPSLVLILSAELIEASLLMIEASESDEGHDALRSVGR